MLYFGCDEQQASGRDLNILIPSVKTPPPANDVIHFIFMMRPLRICSADRQNV